MDVNKNRAFKLRNKTVDELVKNVADLKSELSSLRVNKVAQGVASKLSKIKIVRKAIARNLTIVNQKKRQDLKNAFSSRKGIKKYNDENGTKFSLSKLPKELKPRLTRSLRRKLTKNQSSKLLLKIKKTKNAFPQRSFALRA